MTLVSPSCGSGSNWNLPHITLEPDEGLLHTVTFPGSIRHFWTGDPDMSIAGVGATAADRE
jgi:hypothetical protein